MTLPADHDDREAAVAALLAVLAASVTINFTGTGTKNSATITGVSTTAGMFAGLPVFGPNVPRGAAIQSFDANAGTVTLTDALTDDSPAGAFSTGFQTVGRRVKYAKDVNAQPALFLRHTADEDESDWGALNHTIIECEVFVFSRAGEDPDAVPDTTLSHLVRAIRRAMKPDDDDRQVFTLGGIAYWCGIKGRSEYDDGALDGQSKAYIPISIMLP